MTICKYISWMTAVEGDPKTHFYRGVGGSTTLLPELLNLPLFITVSYNPLIAENLTFLNDTDFSNISEFVNRNHDL